jgi:hypothetical protein
MTGSKQPPADRASKRGISDRALLIALLVILLVPILIALGLWWALYDMFEFARIPDRPT